MATAASGLDELRIIDTDAHITEPENLWSSQAPAGWKDKLPRLRLHRAPRLRRVPRSPARPYGPQSAPRLPST